MKKLYIISNEKISENNGQFYCDNIDIKSTPEGLKEFFEVQLIAKKSQEPRKHFINLDKVKVFKSLLSFLIEIIKIPQDKNSEFLIISLSPYTFLACILLRIFKKKPFIYLRSNGFDEYKLILGTLGYLVYFFMFYISLNLSHFISCRKYILKGCRGDLVAPSQLSNKWFENVTKPNFNSIKLLFVGRIRKEKGIFSLLEILKNNQDINLTIVGESNNESNIASNSNVNILKIISNTSQLIKTYDSHNIFILPSYTEGYPMVLLESLSRFRPVIIFPEVKHIIGDKKGIFVSERNHKSLMGIVNFIKDNIDQIQEDMEKNSLPTNEDFIVSLKKIILK